VALAGALRRLRLRPAVDVAALPGRPDLVFRRWRLAVFCDGDFWHGRGLAARLKRLAAGHNPGYWVEKIRANVARDRRNRRRLKDTGWTVLRFWETDILHDPSAIAERIARALAAQRLDRLHRRQVVRGDDEDGGVPLSQVVQPPQRV
jgi:DNA mismatch endonuclease (patch repair protein)